MTGDHRDRIAQHDSKDVPRFAPNFTVYVLPPDVVCLYSEDRKFFLHGEPSGGYNELAVLDRSGALREKLAARAPEQTGS